jgi:CheY-like chemotaxis protein
MATNPTILVADDCETDLFILNRAATKSGLNAEFHNVMDGEQVIAYLAGEGAFANRNSHPLPVLMLLDLKMPKVSGFDVLQWMQAREQYRNIPVAVFSSSDEPRDIGRAYALGATTYIVKPTSSDDYHVVVRQLGDFLAELDCRSVVAA